MNSRVVALWRTNADGKYFCHTFLGFSRRAVRNCLGTDRLKIFSAGAAVVYTTDLNISFLCHSEELFSISQGAVISMTGVSLNE